MKHSASTPGSTFSEGSSLIESMLGSDRFAGPANTNEYIEHDTRPLGSGGQSRVSRDDFASQRSATIYSLSLASTASGSSVAGERGAGSQRAETVAPSVAASEARRTTMDDMAREWVNARLEATEERMNARLAGIEADLKMLVGNVGALTTSMNAIKNKADAIESAQSNTKFWIIGTAITLLLGTVGSVVAVLAFGLQAFESARALIEFGQSLPK